MNTKERFYAVIGGCIGSVLTMGVCLFLPIGVQSQANNFGEITCRELKVVDKNGKILVVIDEALHGGSIDLYRSTVSRGRFDPGEVSIGINEYGGQLFVMGRDTSIGGASVSIYGHGGDIAISGNGTGLHRGKVRMRVNDEGSGEVATYDENGDRIAH